MSVQVKWNPEGIRRILDRVASVIASRLDGWSLAMDRSHGYVPCDEPDERLLWMRCDLPAGHKGQHRSRAVTSGGSKVPGEMRPE